jgi:MoaA/NifB/PqqE/SkfB family radical SAM enzyme
MRPSVSDRIYPFEVAIDAISMVREVNPNIEITIRTVVSKQNVDGVLKIADLLNKIRGRFDRWKLYPFTPAANVPPKAREYFKIKSEEFVRVVDQASQRYPGIKIDKYNPFARKGRYIFIGEDASVFTVDEKENFVQLGNFLKLNSQLLKQMAKHTIPDRNIKI